METRETVDLSITGKRRAMDRIGCTGCARRAASKGEAMLMRAKGLKPLSVRT